MNKKILISIIAVVVLLLVIFLAFAIGNNQSDTSDLPSSATESSPENSFVDESHSPSTPDESSRPANNISEDASVGEESDISSESSESDISVSSPESSVEESTETSEEVSEEISEEVSEETGPNLDLTYAEYREMSADEQQAHYESFDSVEDFFAWYNEAKKVYDDENKPIEISGTIDFSDIINGNK